MNENISYVLQKQYGYDLAQQADNELMCLIAKNKARLYSEIGTSTEDRRTKTTTSTQG